MYPVIFSILRLIRTSRLLMLVRPVILLPYLVWALPYSFAVDIVTILAFLIILVTGTYPRSMWKFSERYFRFLCQIEGFSLLLSDKVPPFNGRADNGYPLKIKVFYPERMARMTVFFRVLLSLPSMFSVSCIPPSCAASSLRRSVLYVSSGKSLLPSGA